MTKKQMTRDEEYEFYVHPRTRPRRVPVGVRGNLSEMVPVRFDPGTLEVLRAAAEADDRSVSSCIRKTVEHELEQRAG